MDFNRQNRKSAANSTFAIGGVSCFADSLEVAEILCSASTLVVKIPPIANLQTVSGNGRATVQIRKVSAKNGLTKSQRFSKIKRAASHRISRPKCSTFYFAPTHQDSSDIVNNFMWTFIVHKNIIHTFGQKLS
jgi:hypothetical protein